MGLHRYARILPKFKDRKKWKKQISQWLRTYDSLHSFTCCATRHQRSGGFQQCLLHKAKLSSNGSARKFLVNHWHRSTAHSIACWEPLYNYVEPIRLLINHRGRLDLRPKVQSASSISHQCKMFPPFGSLNARRQQLTSSTESCGWENGSFG